MERLGQNNNPNYYHPNVDNDSLNDYIFSISLSQKEYNSMFLKQEQSLGLQERISSRDNKSNKEIKREGMLQGAAISIIIMFILMFIGLIILCNF